MDTPGAYVRYQSRSRETGTTVQILDLTHPDSEFEGRAATVCIEHSTIVRHETLKAAKKHVGTPSGWCEGCTEIVEKRRALATRRRSPVPHGRR